MKTAPALVCCLAAFAFAGCAGNRVVEGLSGRWGRTFSVDQGENRAQVSEVWQFNGSTASLHATWNGSVPPGESVEGIAGAGPYITVIDQGWSVKYRGRGVFRLEEKGRRVAGPKFMEFEDSYDLGRDGNELSVDGGPSDAPLHRLLEGAAANTATPPAAAPRHKVKKKKQS